MRRDLGRVEPALDRRHLGRAVVLAAFEQEHVSREAVVHADELVAVHDRPRHRRKRDPQILLDVVEQLEWVHAGPVALVHEGEHGRLPLVADLEQLPRALFHAAPVVEEHHGRVGGDERSVRVFREVRVPRRVEQVHLVALPVELQHARRDRDPALLFELHPVGRRVARGAARLYRAREVDRATVEQQLLRQRRLPRVGVRDDRERAAAGGLALDERGQIGGRGREDGGGHGWLTITRTATCVRWPPAFGEAAAARGPILASAARMPTASPSSDARPVALITGATDGIGRATATALADRGFAVLVHGRDAGRATTVADTIRSAGGEARAVVADLAQLADVARLAAELQAGNAARLDILVNNAGVAFRGGARHLSADGFELTFAVNHLAHMLLTLELLPLLEATGHVRGAAGPARVATVASELHARGRLDFDDLQGEHRYAGGAAYAQSKLANVLFARALARRVDPRAVVSHALHPGVVKTKLLRDGFGSNGGVSVERGAATSVVVATSPEAGRTTGGYWAHEQPAPPAPQALDDALGERLWAVSETLLSPWRSHHA